MQHEKTPRGPESEELAALRARIAELEATEERLRRMEETLRQSEHLFRTVAEFTYDWETWRDPDGKYIFVSRSCERISGYRREQFMEDPWLITKIVHPEDQEMVSRHLKEDFGQQDLMHMDFRIIARDGGGRWLSHYCQAVYGDDGTWLGRRASNRDITVRKRAETELRRANRALRVLGECGQAIVRATDEVAFLRELTQVVVSSGGYRLAWVGLAEQDEKRTVRPVAQAGFEEGYLEKVEITWGKTKLGRGPTGTAIRTGRPSICKNILQDPAYAPWRSEAIKRGYASSIALPLTVGNRIIGALNIYAAEPDAFDSEEVNFLIELADGLSYAIMALRVDEERKRAEKQLKESEARYRAIVEDQTELICRFLPDGRITFVNQAYCEYFGKRYGELVGKTFMALIPVGDRGKVEEHLASLSPQNPVATHEHRVIDPNGEIRWQRWTNRMVLDGRGRLIEFQSVGRDITEGKRAEEALIRSSEKIKMFAYSVSHDLKNPAVAIYGLAKLLHRNYGETLDEKGRSHCDQILKAAEHIASLVEKINAYIQTKEVPLQIEKVSLSEIVQIVKEEFSSQLSLREIKCTAVPLLPQVRADRLSLIRIVRNLVDNALKHGGDELKEIKIGGRETDEFHILYVEDDGVGISEEDAEKIFGAFWREKASLRMEGAGLGLAIVKEIAERHRGNAWVHPGPEKGAVFCVSLSKHL